MKAVAKSAKMDVDLLRPGTVPISPDKILWFEFLLDSSLLKNHLCKPGADPSAFELIIEFLSIDGKNVLKPPNEIVMEIDCPPSPPASNPATPQNFTRKQLALKILTLKVAAALKWNLDEFEAKLPPHIQQQLMQDLVFMATDMTFSTPPPGIPVEFLHKPQVQFALTLFHRWVLRFPVKAALYSKFQKNTSMQIPGMQADTGYSPINPHFEKVLRFCEASRMQSLQYLEEIVSYLEKNQNKDDHKINVPTIDTFMHLTEDSDEINHKWDSSEVSISPYEFLVQIHYDICCNYFFYGHHDLAKKHILRCRENMNQLERHVSTNGYDNKKTVPWGNFHYTSVIKEDIVGYIRALNLAQEVLNEEPSLLQKLQESIANHYTGIVSVLQADNLAREIPLAHRQVVELDIQGSASSGAFTVAKDLLNRVSALNAVRYALDGGIPSTQPDFINKFKTVGIKFFDLLFWALAPVLTSKLSKRDWENLKIFFLHLATSSCKIPIDRIDEYIKKHTGETSEKIRRKLISDEELKIVLDDLKKNDYENMELPRELLTDDWETPEFDCQNAPELEMGKLKKKIIEASTADEIRMCLVKLAKMSPSIPLWKINPAWKPMGNLESALIALPRGFLQDFGYIISSTARARVESGCTRAALSLLSTLESDARGQLGNGNDPTLFKLCKLLSWEVILLQVMVVLSEWPHHRLNLSVLANKCKACIVAASSNESPAPRSQVIEACWICLVNSCEWEVPNWSGGVGEAAAGLCVACFELQRGKGSRKFPRMLWDHALSVFNMGASKRNASGNVTSQSRDRDRDRDNTATAEARLHFNNFLATLREPLAITVMLSLLTKIYNLIADDSTQELFIEYIGLWPASISNLSNYSSKFVMESLTDLLERSLKIYPYNTSWLRLYGDVESACSRPGAALRRYLCSIAAASWYFTKRSPDEGAIARKAARCCQALNCPTQAAALCQLPDEPDYTTAFKCLAEKATNVADAMDANYTCIWDGTLLEVCVAFHARRGEAGRRARAVTAAGALELNANNAEDIAHEAASIRRARLLRALTNQYVA